MAIRSIAKAHGWKPAPPFDRKAILNDYLGGMALADVAAKYGCNQAYPSSLAKLAGVKRDRSLWKKWANGGWSQVTPTICKISTFLSATPNNSAKYDDAGFYLLPIDGQPRTTCHVRCGCFFLGSGSTMQALISKHAQPAYLLVSPGISMATPKHSRAAKHKSASSIPYYLAVCKDRKWEIVRASDRHTFCYCQSEEEAIKIANALNVDRTSARNPKEE